jgi:hypothetical protein
MSIKQILETFNYQITEGSPYQWKCYGPNARFLDFESDLANGSIIFDSKNQTVYQAEVWLKDSYDSPYRYIHSDFVEAHTKESKARGVDINIAFDNVKFIDLEVFEDFLEKAKAIWRGQPFDKRIQVPIDDDVFYDLATEAHKQDITVNALVEKILLEVIEREKTANNTVIV